MKVKIYFSNDQKQVPLKPAVCKLITKAVAETLRQERFPHSTEISLSFIDNEEIHQLNLVHREKDKPTDVLSFPMWEREELFDGSALDGDSILLGDIIISAEKAKEQAEEYGHSLERELAFLSVHSTLHLLGYDHERSEKEDRYMNNKQENVLTKIGLPRE